MADVVIFQSEYQKKIFIEAGYSQNNSRIIYNGAPDDFWVDTPVYPNDNGVLKLMASSFSIRSIKRHDLIARISELPNVEVNYAGNWPPNIPLGRVNLLGVIKGGEIRSLLDEHHYFLHPAMHDACPNAILEAMAVGLPIIFNAAPGGSSELVGDSGISLNEMDLKGSIDLARIKLSMCRKKVLKRREMFRFHIAAAQYENVFRSTLMEMWDKNG
jgi:glycosyltransferase involved in cell wall biosynthesis